MSNFTSSLTSWFDVTSSYNFLSHHVDSALTYVFLNYATDLLWLTWLLYPIVVTFVLPFVIVLFLYASALVLQLYVLRRHFFEAYRMERPWDGARRALAACWDAQGKIWHDYEIDGFEKIPNEGPAVIVYYHGALPVDFYYFVSRVILRKTRQIQAVGDRFLFMIPGFKLLMEVFCVMPGTLTSCVELLNQGHLLAIAPGGVREALFSDEYYGILWGKRVGFAKIAVEAKVSVIPMFTQNCRETFRSLSFGRSWLRRLYESTRLPLVPIYGGFPVKMRTFIGDPITYDPLRTPEQLAAKVHQAMDELIKEHQRIPGNILCALLDRCRRHHPS